MLGISEIKLKKNNEKKKKKKLVSGGGREEEEKNGSINQISLDIYFDFFHKGLGKKKC